MWVLDKLTKACRKYVKIYTSRQKIMCFLFSGEYVLNHYEYYGLTYFQHFKRAMSMSLALFIHAFVPSLLSNYASSKMSRLD